MNFAHLAYKIIGTGCAMALIPPVWLQHCLSGASLDRFHQRLGLYPRYLRDRFHGQPRIWLHAVSVGEVGVAAAIIQALHHFVPPSGIALSTTTEQGLAQAQALLPGDCTCFYLPLDLDGPVQLAFNMVRPDVLALLETEIWPNLIVTASRVGVRTALLNGRISVRSIQRYLKIRPLIRHTLAHVDQFSMASDDDARRIRSLGAPAARVLVNGNAKFDRPEPSQDDRFPTWGRTVFGLNDETRVWVAGSTRHPEEQTLLDAFVKVHRAFPQTILIIAPRHIQRVAQIEQWVRQRGLQCQRRTALDGNLRPRTAGVVILDTMGELPATYSVASFVYCGGSLIPKGGQNLLEAVQWGKPVMCGPSMEDFIEAYQLLAAAGGVTTVHSCDDICATALEWLGHPQKALCAGQAGRQAILRHRGAARKHAAVIARLLDTNVP